MVKREYFNIKDLRPGKDGEKVKKIIKRLKLKADDKGRMPSIVDIHNLLEHYGIEHYYRESHNTVEYKNAGNRYVNSRHDGKEGHKIEIEKPYLELDTSDSYYSYNSYRYARDILELIKEK